MNTPLIYSLILLSFFTLSCNSEKNTKEKSLSNNNSNSSEIRRTTISDISLQLPLGWVEETPDNDMRIGQLALENNSEHKIAVFFFGPQDLAEANIQRWRKQFTLEEEYKELAFEKSSVIGITIKGVFKKKPFPMSQEFVEISDYATIAAIVQTKGGPYYFKLSAPSNIIDMQEKSFIEMINSINM